MSKSAIEISTKISPSSRQVHIENGVQMDVYETRQAKNRDDISLELRSSDPSSSLSSAACNFVVNEIERQLSVQLKQINEEAREIYSIMQSNATTSTAEPSKIDPYTATEKFNFATVTYLAETDVIEMCSHIDFKPTTAEITRVPTSPSYDSTIKQTSITWHSSKEFNTKQGVHEAVKLLRNAPIAKTQK